MSAMKKHLPILFALAALSGCSSIYVPTLKEVPVRPTNTTVDTSKTTYRLASNHWSDVSKIRDEATRLSYQVSQGQITKVQAAQYLNRYRIQLVGRNAVDDSVYDVYLRSAVDSQRGAINTEQSKLYIQNALKGWQQRWPNMRNKPANPAFTNFLMEVMNMKPLQ
ncbi:MAG: prokaryotic membrane lipolipid attachment site family protein [Neisseria sp.]|nr:prokaryotic membrane lipolipid attachment site family protein [Neisseria sp.]